MSSLTSFAGSVPENYDKYLGPYLFEPYALDLIERLRNEKSGKVLELACGTGRVTKHLVSLLTYEGSLVATDLNPDMIAVAKSKVEDERISWEVVDAHNLLFEQNIFDHVVCQFGVMFFQDKPKAFSETFRVLKKGGKFIFNTWGSLEDNPRTGLIKDVMEEFFPENAPEFLQKGPYSFYNQGEIKQLMTEAGFSDIVITEVRKSVANWSIEDFLKGFLEGSPLNAFLAQHDSSTKEKVNQKLKDALLEKFGANSDTALLAYVVEGVNK